MPAYLDLGRTTTPADATVALDIVNSTKNKVPITKNPRIAMPMSEVDVTLKGLGYPDKHLNVMSPNDKVFAMRLSAGLVK
jgi:hypothetical protein